MSTDTRINVEDLARITPRMLEGIIKHQELTYSMDADEIDAHNDRLCIRRANNFVSDNPQLFVESIRQAI